MAGTIDHDRRCRYDYGTGSYFALSKGVYHFHPVGGEPTVKGILGEGVYVHCAAVTDSDWADFHSNH